MSSGLASCIIVPLFGRQQNRIFPTFPFGQTTNTQKTADRNSSKMSWPGEWTPPTDSGSDNGMGDAHGRPTDLASVGTFSPSGKLAGLTPAQQEQSLRMPATPYENLPQMPAFSSLLMMYNPRWHRANVAAVLSSMAGAMGRVLTPEEADAVAYHRALFCQKMAYTTPAVLSTAIFMAVRGRKTFRFPFYTPKPATFNPMYFPNAAKSLLTGPRAVNLWHGLRFSAYWIVCQMIVGGLVTSYANTTYLMGLVKDPRIQGIRAQAQQAHAHDLSHINPTAPRPPRPQTANPDETAPPAPTYGRGWDRPEQQQQPQQQQQPWQQQAASAPKSAPQTAQQDDDAFLFDDASPVASSQKQQPQTPSTASDGVSAWERLRQQAKAGQDPWKQDSQQGGQPAGQQKPEQYSYSSSEREKAYAKEQAQKDFDAMLERERQGMGESGGRRF